MNWFNLLKLLHIISVIVGVGGLVARQLLRQKAKMANDIESFTAFIQAAGILESVLVIPGTTSMLVFGILLALIGGYPVFGFLEGASQNWLLVSNILLVGVIIIIPTIFLPRGRKFEPVMRNALEQGRVTAELREAMDDRVVKLAHLYEEAAILAIIGLMVLKPF